MLPYDGAVVCSRCVVKFSLQSSIIVLHLAALSSFLKLLSSKNQKYLRGYS